MKPIVGKPQDILDALRWRADMIITNYEGERVWLKQIKGGITDCCLASAPCQRHDPALRSRLLAACGLDREGR